MRVAYIGNLGAGSAPHSTENHVAQALQGLGVNVLPLHEQRFSWDARDIPKATDLVLWTHTHGFAPPKTHGKQAKFLEGLSRRDIPTVAYHLDLWHGIQRQYQITEEPYFRCDLVCTADGGHDNEWAEAGVNHVWFPPGVSKYECGPGTARDEYRSDIAFVGSWQGGYHPEWRHRQQLVEFLQDYYADRCAFWPRRGEHAIRGRELRDLYASVKVLVGDSCLPNGAHHFWSDRIPETLGRGGLLAHPEVIGLDEHYAPGEHLLTWPAGNWDALANVIDAALSDSAMRSHVRTEGRKHVLRHHTYTVRMLQLFDLMVSRGWLKGYVAPLSGLATTMPMGLAL